MLTSFTMYRQIWVQLCFLLSLAECRMKSHRSIALIHKSTSNGAECYRGLNTTLECFPETNTIGCQSKFLNEKKPNYKT